MSDLPYLETIEIDPEQQPVISVIWMHGLGADASDFYSLPSQLGLPAAVPIRYVFPHAPRMPVTINMGMVMRAWYDISGFDARGHDVAGIQRSARDITRLVEREHDRGVPPQRVIVGGFSQGGAMALFAGLRRAEPLAGIVCLSGYLLLPDTMPDEVHASSRGVPIFQAHGLHDPMVPHALGCHARDALVGAGHTVEWHEYAMGHQVCPDELRDLGLWMSRVL